MPGIRCQVYENTAKKEKYDFLVFVCTLIPTWCQVPGMKRFPFLFVFYVCFLQVKLYLYIPLHTLILVDT